MDRKKVIYIGLVLILTVIVSITYFSYAFFTHRDEQRGKLNIITGTLNYNIKSSDLVNNSITLEANMSKKIELKIISLNNISSKYELYYTTTSNNVEIGYGSSNDTPTGAITANGTKTISIVIKNKSSSSVTVTFGVEGGFSNNTLVLSTGNSITEIIDDICNYSVNYAWDFEFDPDNDGEGEPEEFNIPCTGNYKIELWGAQGSSNSRSIEGAKGSYTRGTIALAKNSSLSFYVGSQSGWNGGGISSLAGYSTNIGGNGGGATDVRISTTLDSRIMVAGAGGGAGGSSGTGDYVYTPSICGYGHTNQCTKLKVSGTTTRPQSQGGNGGGAYAGVGMGTDGDGSSYVNYCIGNGGDGSFGIGGNSVGTAAFAAQTNDNRISIIHSGGTGGGGGGGYFGGGAGGSGCGYWSGTGGYGGGGSSYISGHIGSIAIASATNTAQKSGCLAGTTNIECSYFYDSAYIFTETSIIDGIGHTWTNIDTGIQSNNLMPNPEGGYYASGVGHTGNGYARITYLGD